jgi:hypothetical protein
LAAATILSGCLVREAKLCLKLRREAMYGPCSRRFSELGWDPYEFSGYMSKNSSHVVELIRCSERTAWTQPLLAKSAR